MQEKNSKHNWDSMIDIIQRSYRIQTHLDFYNWHQQYFTTVFPHDVLIAVWGDFQKGELHYDVCSKNKSIRTQCLFHEPKNFDYFVNSLYKNWLANEKRWYRINDLFSLIDTKDLPTFFTQRLSEINSMLVYGINDIRGNNDCIYIFLDQGIQFPAPELTLGMIMPHLDAALRRIESFEEVHEDDLEHYFSQGLTEREHEILHWVKMGKTNIEISCILEISLNTVKNHLKRIFAKLDVSTRAHAVATYSSSKVY